MALRTAGYGPAASAATSAVSCRCSSCSSARSVDTRDSSTDRSRARDAITRAGQGSCMKTSWYDALADGIRKNRTPGDEGAFWVLFLDDERCPAFCAAFPPAAELGPPEYDGLAEVIDAVDAPALVFVVP